MPEQVSVAQAAAILGESRWTTQRRINTGQLPATKVGERIYVIERSDVDTLAVTLAASAS